MRKIGGGTKQKSYKLAELPLFLRAAIARDPELKACMRQLADSGVETIYVSRARRTSPDVIEALHEHDPGALITRALRPPDKNEDKAVAPIRAAIADCLRISVTESSPVHPDQMLLERINGQLGEQRMAEAIRRFSYDLPHKEKIRLAIFGALSLAAVGFATLLDAFGFNGWGLLVAQSTDDVGNTVISAISSRRGKVPLAKVLKDFWPVVPVLAAAAAADNMLIAQLLESPNTLVKSAGGFLFGLAAVGGSAAANIISLIKSSRYRKSHKGLIHTKPHPFNTSLWFGVGLSMVVSQYAAAKGILTGHTYSGLAQTMLGGVETMTAFGGTYLVQFVSRVSNHIRDLASVISGRAGS